LAVIEAGEAEVKADSRAAKWFDAVSPWRPENFERKLAADPTVIARAGPAAKSRAVGYAAATASRDETNEDLTDRV
jgi:hypothetical protein